uniref:Putative type I PKS n=1 Tax=Cladonia uncialis subsp. uncialis TaxID=180999 RepID=A0A1Z1CCN7_CLAUC|nr:putative type I PKS [Cladonia uncialis subsp. uncialis]
MSLPQPYKLAIPALGPHSRSVPASEPIPLDCFSAQGFYHESGQYHGHFYVREAYFLAGEGVHRRFDAAFFETVYEALKAAGLTIESLQGSNTAVYTGQMVADYDEIMMRDSDDSLAVQQLRMGHSRVAIAAGANLLMDPKCFISLRSLNMLFRDGRSRMWDADAKGPNHAAQTQLNCYSRAGLNLANTAHGPQYFECHGTGTLAGDAAEAEAINCAFFPTTVNTGTNTRILKASLALQNVTIPPNLLFNRLNPRIEPFYSNLKLPVASNPWPSITDDGPRRASVNSFGFGGANVHAILESYEPGGIATLSVTSLQVAVFTPFVFSAFSETSLIAILEKFHQHLEGKSDSVNLRDLAYTLHSRRTGFQVTAAFAGFLRGGSKSQDLQDHGCPKNWQYARRKSNCTPRRLAFWGTALSRPICAQFAGMGIELLRASKVASQVIERLETRLLQLPVADRPTWSLRQELEKEPSSSRIVDLSRDAGILFHAVVGHSSGEVAAAYAAGFISVEDAICIAYYRGLHSILALGSDGSSGAMMAIGTSAEDMQELCADPDFRRRIWIAAINSPISLTVSGDRDAIDELKIILVDEKNFSRVLRVDEAYHSHHMLPCSEACLNSLAALDMHVDNGGQFTWFSSVLDIEDMSGRQMLLRGKYWDSNMIRPVLIGKAIANACTVVGPFDCALEVGPHPTLNGPALQIIQQVSGSEIPYTGLFHRNASAVESVAEGLAYIWSHLGKDAIDLQRYDRYVSGHSHCSLLKGLPTYAWDHKEYWNESRYAKAIRLRPGPVHKLLGHMTPDSNEQDMRWRHVLKPTEIPWLSGHRLQNQVIYPSAENVITALEAAMAMCKRKRVVASLLELSEVELGRALVFEEDDSNVKVKASFRYHAADGKVGSSLSLMANARVHISLGEVFDEALPARAPKPPNLLKVRPGDFYAASRDLEYQWAGPFVALDKLERKLGAAVGTLNIVEPSELILHPALLDAAFQSVLLAYSFPDDGQLWTIHVLRRIERLTVNPSLARETSKEKPLSFASSHNPETVRMIGNLDIFPVAAEIPIAGEQRELAEQLERIAGFIVRKFIRETPAAHSFMVEGQHARILFATDVISPAQAGHMSLWRPEWENDTHEQLISACQPCAHTVEMQILKLIGYSLPDIFKADKEPIKLDNTFTEKFCSDALGMGTSNRHLARTVKQLTYRHPHLDILGIGAGTDSAAEAIIHEIGPTFSSYTLTDMFPSPVEPTKPWAAPHLHKIFSKTLDIRQNPIAQGFSEQSYDLVVASLILYSSSGLRQTLQNARRLLKPGGHLIILELLRVQSSVYPLIFGAIPGMWQGVDVDGVMWPDMGLSNWDHLLQGSGFSGCNSSTPTTLEQSCIAPFTVLLSQAVDGKRNFPRYPLKFESDAFFEPDQMPCAKSLWPFQNNPLTELESSIFQYLEHEQWEALKGMVMSAGVLLWIMQGRRARNPFANIMAGLLRLIICKGPTISYQMLDFEDANRIDPHSLSEALLLLRAEILWRRQDNMPTSIENELVLDEEGRLIIPRLIVKKGMNDRYNSSKRAIIDRFNPHQQNINIVPMDSQSGYELIQEPEPSFEDGTVVARMEVTLSLLSAVRVAEFGCMFLKLGKQGASEDHMITLSNKILFNDDVPGSSFR